jgi:hypothetical protein
MKAGANLAQKRRIRADQLERRRKAKTLQGLWFFKILRVFNNLQPPF